MISLTQPPACWPRSEWYATRPECTRGSTLRRTVAIYAWKSSRKKDEHGPHVLAGPGAAGKRLSRQPHHRPLRRGAHVDARVEAGSDAQREQRGRDYLERVPLSRADRP